MREILFRGKRIDNGEWVVGIPWIFAPPVNKAVIVYAMGLVGEDDDTSRYCECHEVDPSTIGQYTGLTDKNDKKIFEGDIVSDGGFSGIVVFDDKDDGAFLVIDPFAVDTDGEFFSGLIDREVVGNIHDDPELLEIVDEP